MKLPPRYRDLVLSDAEPGDIYRRAVAMLRADGLRCDYQLTETLVYATEVRYALDVIRNGRPDRVWNFGDPTGDAEARLWAVLDPVRPRRLAVVGHGPYPVTAALIAERYPDAAITCVDNSVTAYLLGQAVLERLGVTAECALLDAADVDYRPFDAVIVAAMVSGKRELVAAILASSRALVVVKSRVGAEHPRVIEMPSPFADDGTLDGGLAP